jgi:MFS family permease
MWQPQARKDFRHNFTVNVLDGAFFGVAALGFASFETVIPLFINTLTSSTTLIGLVTSLHTVGWMLPQLFTAGRVARLRRYKPFVMFMTFHERWPFFGLAAVAFTAVSLGPTAALILAYLMVIIASMGGGFAATAWQSMIGKVMPPDRRGTFFGSQSAAANLLGAGGAVLAGIMLDRLPSPLDFTLCFLLAGVFIMVSMIFLGLTREPAHEIEAHELRKPVGLKSMLDILRRDRNFRWYLIARNLSQLSWAAVSFYVIYAVRYFNMNEETAGVMMGVMLIARTISNPLLGYISDHWGYRNVLVSGAVMIAASAVLALLAPSLNWFYLVFALAGFAQATIWAISITFTLEFGTVTEKPLYIGMANTLVAPAALLAPLIGGWMADTLGFGAAFLTSAVFGFLAASVLQFYVTEPRAGRSSAQPVVSASAEG